MPQMWVCWMMIMLLLWPTTIGTTSSSDVKSGCNGICGNVSVPYPFGIDDPNCAMNEYFFLNCSSSSDGSPELFLGNNSIPVHSINETDGTMTVRFRTAFGCYNKSGMLTYNHDEHWIRLGHGQTFSSTRNKFAALGCDTLAMVTNNEMTYGAACMSSCSETVSMADTNNCRGSGCCLTSIPKNLKSVTMTVSSLNNHTDVWEFNPCGYAFLVEETSFNASKWKLSDGPDKIVERADVVIEWVAQTESCQEASKNQSAYACASNSKCIDSEGGEGYRCLCNDGFQGNPYRPQGCLDIDECEDPQNYPCKGTCKNTIGNYKCSCPFGMHGDGKSGCQGFAITTIVAIIGGSISVVIISILVYIICMKRRKDKNFRENGGRILQHQRVRIFGEAALTKATNNYEEAQKLGEGGFGSVYKGVLGDNTLVAVKKSKGVDKAQMNEDFQQEIATVSQVNHRNVVKLLGLCLETKVPLLVYEFISNGTLYEHIHEKRSQILTTWKNRLRIAAETALALDYLHSLADPPIIHGDVKSVNILLDDNYTAKISDFGASVLISPEQTTIASKMKGTFGYLDPEYLMTGNLTAMSDVYSFGVVLVELLTGEKPNSSTMKKSGEKRNIIQYFVSSLKSNNLFQILDFQVANEGEQDEIEEVAELAARCVNVSGVNRPTMKEVSVELANIKDLHKNLWSQQNSEETEHLLGESSSFPHCQNASTPSIRPQAHTVISFEMENYSDSI